MYRTLHFRYVNSRRFKDLENLLYDGAILLLDRQQHNSGADLANLFIDTLSKDTDMKEAMKDEQEANNLSIRIGELLSRIPADTPERMKYTGEVLKLNSKIFPMQRIRRQFALILWKEKNYVDSRKHFLHASYTCGEDCALMLIEYHVDSGYKSEADLFIAQFILQLLCIKTSSSANIEEIKQPLTSSLSSSDVASSSSTSSDISHNCNLNNISPKSNQHAYAIVILQHYLAKHPLISKSDPPSTLPLINFLWFLLIAIEGGKTSTFNVLLDKYGPVLNRDPAYKEYLQRIGELYFGIRPVHSNRGGFGGFLSNFLQSFVEDNDDDSNDDEDGGDSSSTGVNTASGSAEQSANNSRTSLSARQNLQQSEDLD
uniref:Golgi to ER traffic protein 4 homolog n=2 Tax=Tetranychus urticae TaxID=32264 RepID=T1L3Y4_TETUR